jgi:non-ribosomal peptide synthetase component F
VHSNISAGGNAVTLFMTLLVAFKVLLARYSGQDDVVLGSPSANRSLPELYRLIGFFVNNLVLRTDLSGNPSFAELLGRIREVTLRAYEHQDVPFDRLVQALRPERSLDHSPLFQVMFILQNFVLDDFEFAGLAAEPLEIEIETARFDLTVEIFPRQGELWMYFDRNADLYEPETIERIQQHYLAILNAVCADPSQKIASIPLLSASELQRLLVDWNQTANPDRLAVLVGGDSCTYRELDRRTNRIAELLKRRGAGPDMLVALCLARSTDLSQPCSRSRSLVQRMCRWILPIPLAEF